MLDICTAYLNAAVVALKGHNAAGLAVVQPGHNAHLGQLEALHRCLHIHQPGQLEVLQSQLHQLMQNLFGHVPLQEVVVAALTGQICKNLFFNAAAHKGS